MTILQHDLFRYWQCLPGASPPPPPPASPEVATGTYLDKTPVYPDAEGGLTGFTNLEPVLPTQTWTVTGTGELMVLIHIC